MNMRRNTNSQNKIWIISLYSTFEFTKGIDTVQLSGIQKKSLLNSEIHEIYGIAPCE